jgi:hypothetical protein
MNIEWQIVAGISTLIIALCALCVSIWQVRQGIKHNRLQVRPHLDTWTETNPQAGHYAVMLMNNGLGPAIIENFSIRIDGNDITGIGSEPIEKGLKILFPDKTYTSHQSFVARGYCMAEKEKCQLVIIQFQTPLPSAEYVTHAFNRSEVKIVYKSLYEEEFEFSTKETDTNLPLRSKRS